MPEETLFIDDKRPNVEAARALGIQAIEYSSVEGLREELIARGLDGVLPLPGMRSAGGGRRWRVNDKWS